jgi:transcriptional regulator with XRE-family HTH domain
MAGNSARGNDEKAHGGGQFAEALRSAIRSSGLSLDRIQARLRAHGTPISIAALSYWQSGKRQPERNDSLTALGELEKILKLPVGSLLALLPPPRPRGKQVVRCSQPLTETVRFERDVLLHMLTAIGTPDALDQEQQLSLVGLHDRCQLSDDGGQRSITTRAVFEARGDGQDRWLLIYNSDDPAAGAPMLTTVRNCHLGRQQVDTANGLMVAELMFDKPIRRGDTYLIEYELANAGPPYPTCNRTHWREFRRPIREYLLEIHFNSADVPTRCQQFARPAGQKHPRMRNLALDACRSVHAVAIDFGPGLFGIEWE